MTDVARDHVDRTDAEAAFPVEALQALRDTGLLGLLVDATYGGLGGSIGDLLTATSDLARADLSLAMIFTMHCQQVAAVARFAPEPLRSDLLAEIAAGRCYLASVTTEAGKGGDLLRSEAQLAAAGGRLLLDRHAPIVTGGKHADGYLVTMLDVRAEADHQVSLVFARRDQLAIRPTGDWQPLGMRASDSGALHLRGEVSTDQVIGEPGRFSDIVSSVFGPLAHLGWSAAWLGTASGALSRVVCAYRDGRARGKVNLDSELLLTRIASVRQRLEIVNALMWRCADLVEREANLGHPRVQLLLNGLKVTASEECYAAVETLVELTGMQHGYLRGSPTRLERAMRDLRSASLNYHNDRLRLANGKLALLDREVSLA